MNRTTDALGLPMSGADAEAGARYDAAVALLQCYRGDPVAEIDAALARRPELVMGHALRGWLHLLGTEPGGLLVAREALEAARRLTAEPRERGHLLAIEHVIEGRWHAAARVMEDVTIAEPRDALGLLAGHQLDFFTGHARMLRDRIARALPHWDASMPGYHALLGMHAFGLEETGDYLRAEIAGRRGVELEPRDGWSQHAVAHVLEMQSRAADGVAWMRSHDGWAKDSFFQVHNWWHLALFHLEAGDIDAVVELFDGPIFGAKSGVVMDMVDASSLLWRLELGGVDLGQRWAALAESWSPVATSARYAFNDVHAMMAFVGAGREADARAVLAAQEGALARRDDNAAFIAEVGRPAALAILAFGAGDYARTVELLRPIRSNAHRFGGSHAQRDVLDLTLLEAAVRAGDAPLAAALAAERADRRPQSPLSQLFVERARSLVIGGASSGTRAPPKAPAGATRRPEEIAVKKETRGQGGEIHQTAASPDDALTTDQGVRIADNQSSLKAGDRGPTLLEDFILREKITHFDHERIPERIVHARGYGAHGYFQPYASHAKLTKAAFLQSPQEKTPVFVRFSTVAGNKGSVDLARDVRGFAVKFYTKEGNFDLVGNNIPVFFIQDAIKFPDLIHSVKPERDRGFPQAQSAHDTFWDFVSLTPESMHMLMWVMSDRAIPRSFRMMEGFGVHTFRFIDAEGASRFVKFHWRPTIGSQSVMWNEALKINGADPDFHRKDLWQAIERGDFPEYELSVQIFDEAQADGFDFDILDASKIIPEELVPLTPLGKMVLDRNVDEFFAETEQVAFCPSHLVPGLGFTNDPLLQGRLFSYLDTQLKRLGGPNFHQIPINAAQCPVHNFHRGGHMQMHVPKRGRISYEPNSLEGGVKAEHPSGFSTLAEAVAGEKRRIRPESFADHYTQARLFWKSMTEPEQRHIVNAFAFELGNCEMPHIRKRMLGHLVHVDRGLSDRVADALGMPGAAETITPPVPPKDPSPSPALSIVGKAPKTLKGRKIGVLVCEGSDEAFVAALRKAAENEGAVLAVVAPKIGGAKGQKGVIEADHALSAGPSVLFDAVVVAPGQAGVDALAREADAAEWIANAYRHCKIIGHVAAATPLFDAAGVKTDADDGLVAVDAKSLGLFFDAAKKHRIWDREPLVESPG